MSSSPVEASSPPGRTSSFAPSEEKLTSTERFDECVKLLVIGPQRSGKSCLVQRIVNSWYCESEPTFGVDFRISTIPVDGRKTRLHLWDTTGSSRFAKITHAYYRIAQGIIIVYDSTDPDALDKIDDWMNLVTRYGSDSVVILLCGTKADLLTDSERARVHASASEVAVKLGIPHLQTSSKLDQGVRSAFELIARQVNMATQRRAELVKKESTGLRMIKECWADPAALSCCLPALLWSRDW